MHDMHTYVKVRVCLFSEGPHIRLSSPDTLFLATHIQAIKKLVENLTKSSSFSCVRTTFQLQCFSNTIAQNLDRLQSMISMIIISLFLTIIQQNYTCAAKSTLILENEISLICSLLILGITDNPEPGLWPSPWWW